ncbi:MAG: hypothetical protein GY745_03645 [Actinomycetia bacterium]|nr:hypothetical protein [Actinomycetes bacterium]MCP3913474.1 hypothetical protein [Actinomycetes bacterium]MCP4084140.1 hypothetical protein [Actinomycetes bacterium]
MTARLSQLLADENIDQLASIPLEQIRGRRDDCQRYEAGLSLVRRLAQGRLDIIGHEAARRRDGTDVDVSTLMGDLPDILGESSRNRRAARPQAEAGPDEIDVELITELDGIVSPSILGSTTSEISDAELDSTSGALQDFEQRVSGHRRALHERIDTYQTEITRRYRTGEASVQSLLE